MRHRWTTHRPLIALGLALGLLLPGAIPARAADDDVIVFGRQSFVWTTDPTGSAPQQVTPYTGSPFPPRLSPDGSTIVFGRTGGTAATGIWLVDVDGSNARRILAQDPLVFGAFATHVAWSPEGDRIAWIGTFDTRIRIIDVAGASKGTVRFCTNLGWTKPAARAFDWGRDGTFTVACWDNTAGARTRPHVRVVPPGGGKGVLRYRPPGDVSVTQIRTDHTGRRALVGRGGDGAVIVTADGATAAPHPDVATWSPDGQRLAGSMYTPTGGDLFTIAVSGGAPTMLGVGAGPDWGPIPPVCAAGIEPSNGGELIIGTPDDDELEGTPGNDVICGLGGHDTIRGKGGDDVIDGGHGNDEIVGGPGEDLIVGGRGGDTIHGDTGDHEAPAGGDDVIDGGEGDDFIYAGGGDDRVTGGPGGDYLEGNAGADVLHGGAADDAVSGGPGPDTITGDAGDDTVRGGDDADILLGGTGDDFLLGNADRDRLSGGPGSDTLKGGPANDHLTGGPRKDRLEGEGGGDTLIARDGVRDVVRGGPGPDKARVDPGKDDVTGVETLLP